MENKTEPIYKKRWFWVIIVVILIIVGIIVVVSMQGENKQQEVSYKSAQYISVDVDELEQAVENKDTERYIQRKIPRSKR